MKIGQRVLTNIPAVDHPRLWNNNKFYKYYSLPSTDISRHNITKFQFPIRRVKSHHINTLSTSKSLYFPTHDLKGKLESLVSRIPRMKAPRFILSDEVLYSKQHDDSTVVTIALLGVLIAEHKLVCGSKILERELPDFKNLREIEIGPWTRFGQTIVYRNLAALQFDEEPMPRAIYYEN